MTRLIGIFILSLSISIYAHSQVVINEVSSNNYTTYPDNDGDFEDWIELYNAGASPVNLSNYKLTDNVTLPNKWAFPSITLPNGGYLTLYASGKNKVDFTDHWESLVLENNSWKYTVPGSNITGWTTTSFSDAAWSTGNGGIGYGDGDDATLVTNPTTTVYARRSFNIVDATAIQSLILYMDYDDGFVAYLNGVEISRDNIAASPVDYNSFADTDREAVMYTAGNPTAFAISKTVFQPLLVTGTNVLSIEVHNKSAASSDLSMRAFLLAGISNSTVNYQALPTWFTTPIASNAIHTNFKLSASGETVLLYNSSGTLVNSIVIPALQPNDTYGRIPNGNATISKLLQPATPNSNNTPASSFTGYWTDIVSMSPPAGYYASTQSVTLSALSGSSTIRYTTDGTKPTSASPIYSGPITVSSTQVVRAAAFNTPNYVTSKFETNSYFINDNTTIPVISISTAPANFFSNATGIYVDGPNAGTCAQPYYCYNYWQDWEREIHIEYFDKTKVFQFEQDAGVKILGGWSRASAMKSMQLRAGDEYGKKEFTYPLFTETKKSSFDKFESFTLRNGGNDFNYTMLRDAVNHRVLNSLQPCVDNHLDFEGYEPVLLYINGVYWGLHTLRERVDNSYFDNNAGVGKGDYNLGESTPGYTLTVKKGDLSDFSNLSAFISSNTMTPANYATVKNWLDIDNCIDYWAAEFFHTNWDWPHNNIKFWRPKTGGKWRYIYHDTDFSYGLFGFEPTNFNEFDRVMVTDIAKSVHAPMIKKLLTSTEFKNNYVNRSADLLNTIYNSPYLKTFYDGLSAQLAPEMARHFVKWPQNANSVAGWNNERTSVKTFMDSRVANVRNQITSTLAAGAQVTVNLATSPAGAGKIKISTITPCSLPWTGVYFAGVPVTMEVIPNDGYVFDHWQSTTLITTPNTNKSITLNITSNDNFTAYFVPTTNIPKLTITELNYHSDTTVANNIDSGDWIELYNSGNATLDLSGYIFKDSKPYHEFAIPNGTTLAAGQYLVIASDLTKFAAIFPTVTNVIGSTIFDFSNGGETLSILNPFRTPVVSFTYDDGPTWPTLADGLGTTMERVMTAADLNAATTWFDGCRQGSPGKAYTPCPCLNVNLGPDAILCTSGGSKLLSTGLSAPHTNRKFYWYKDGVALVVPTTTSTLNAASIGLFKVVVDSMGCFKSDQINITADLTFDLGSNISLCSPSAVVLTSSLPNTGVTYVWTKDAVTIAGATGPTLNVSAAGVYALTASAAGCTAKADNITVTSITATPTDAYKCMPSSATLSVTGSGTYKWYTTPTLGVSFNTGTSYTTSFTNTTTYYVENSSFYSGFVGPADSSFGNQSQWVDNNMSAYRFRFNVLKSCILSYVTVYTDGPQNVKITIYDAATGLTPLFTRTVTVSNAGLQRIPLGFSLSVGTGYYMDANGSTGQLYYNHDNAFFPYTEAGGYLSITGTSPAWVGTGNWYPYIYKWEFTNVPGPCDRVPVTAYNTCALPVELISFNGERKSKSSVELNWETATEVNAASYIIERSLDGVHFESIKEITAKGNTAVITSYSYQDEQAPLTTVYYRLKQVDKDGSSSFSETIIILNKKENTLFVAPNPSSETFELWVGGEEIEKIAFSITDLSGKLILYVEGYHTNESIHFGETLTPGSYLLQVNSKTRQYIARIVKY